MTLWSWQEPQESYNQPVKGTILIDMPRDKVIEFVYRLKDLKLSTTTRREGTITGCDGEEELVASATVKTVTVYTLVDKAQVEVPASIYPAAREIKKQLLEGK